MKDVSVSDNITETDTVPDRQCSGMRKRFLTKRVCAHRGKTKKGSIRRKVYLVGLFVPFGITMFEMTDVINDDAYLLVTDVIKVEV